MAAGKSVLEAAPVMLFDDLQDLLKDSRLRAAGGQLVFNMLATLIVKYSVDRKAVRIAVAGSSAELLFAFETLTTAKGNRWSFYDLADPSPTEVESRLVARGYTRDEALHMISLCGTRLRLLERPLKRGAAVVSAASFLAESVVASKSAFIMAFGRLDNVSKGELVTLLDRIAAFDPADAALGPSKVYTFGGSARSRSLKHHPRRPPFPAPLPVAAACKHLGQVEVAISCADCRS